MFSIVRQFNVAFMYRDSSVQYLRAANVYLFIGYAFDYVDYIF